MILRSIRSHTRMHAQHLLNSYDTHSISTNASAHTHINREQRKCGHPTSYLCWFFSLSTHFVSFEWVWRIEFKQFHFWHNITHATQIPYIVKSVSISMVLIRILFYFYFERSLFPSDEIVRRNKNWNLPLIHVMFNIIQPQSHLYWIAFTAPMKNIFHFSFSQPIDMMSILHTHSSARLQQLIMLLVLLLLLLLFSLLTDHRMCSIYPIWQFNRQFFE